MFFDFFSLAIRNLRKRGIRSWLTLLGIFIGVMAVVALIGLGNSLKVAVESQFGVSETEVITVQAGGITGYGPPGSGVVNPLTTDDMDAIDRISGVDKVLPRSLESGKLEYNDRVIFGYTTNVPNGDGEFMYDILDLEAEYGRMLKDSDVGKVVLGYNFFDNKVGLDKVVIPGKKVLIQDDDFEVVGVLKKKGSFIWDSIVLMNDRDLENTFDVNDTIDIIVVHLKDKDYMDRVKENIEKLLRKRRDVKVGEEDFEVSTPEASLGMVNNILSGVQIFIVIIASISIFIGALGIVNTMTTSVLERRKEIGIMKSIGARNEHIFFQFFIESGLLGFFGGLVGVIFGVIIVLIGTAGINNFIGAEMSPNIDFVLIGFTLIGSFIVGAASGIVPAMDAAKQDPVEALRG